ncbi:MAG: hypothetical protein AAFX81_04245 [Pseudomonadota bacterium]
MTAIVVFKALIGFGLPVAFAVRELVLTNRLLAATREREAAEARAAETAPPRTTDQQRAA